MTVSARSLANVRLKVTPSLSATKATQPVAEAGTDNSAFMTSLRTKQQIDARLASQAESEAGTNNTKLQTPLRTKEAVTALVPNVEMTLADADAVPESLFEARSRLPRFPENFGAVNDELVDSSDFLQSYFNAGGTLRTLSNTVFGISKTVYIRPTLLKNLDLQGFGLFSFRIKTLPGFTGTEAVVIQGDDDATQGIASFTVAGFSVIAGSGAPAIGILVNGSATKTLNAVHQNLIQNVHVEGFARNWAISEARLIKFDRCSGWPGAATNSTALSIAVIDTFTGDLDFENCNFIHSGTGCSIEHLSLASGAQIKGIRYSKVVSYGPKLHFKASAAAGGIIGDIYVNPGCQFDGFSDQFFDIRATGSGSVVDNISAVGMYMRGQNSVSGVRAVEIEATSSGRVESIRFQSNWCANFAGGALRAVGVKGLFWIGNDHVETAAAAGSGWVVLLDGTTVRAIVSDNILRQVSAITAAYFIVIGSSCDYITALGNIAGAGVTSGVVGNFSSNNILIANNQ